MSLRDFDKKTQLSRRAFILSLGKFGLFSILGARLGYMQLFKSSGYKVLSYKNSISFIMMPPTRGGILDFKGRLLAVNNQEYRLMLNKREYIGNEESLNELGKILSFTGNELDEISNKIKTAHPKFPVKIKSPLSWKEVAVIEENIDLLPGFFVDIGNKRYYPSSYYSCHTVGYIGTISEEENIETSLKYVNDFKIGKSGIEKSFDEKLRGEFGYRKMEVNSKGVYLRELDSYESQKGADIHSSIDLDLQKFITGLLEDISAVVIVRDLKHNGEIRSLVSSPAYDPNKLTGRISHKEWQEIIENPENPLINKAVSNTYPPGSVFKLVVFLAALERGISPGMYCDCIGHIYVRGKKYRCWKQSGHGVLNMYQAIERSCNTYIYELVMMLGNRPIEEMARKLGFGINTGIELPGESRGVLPTPEWKEWYFSQQWSVGDSLNMAIGQGFLSATPLQISELVTSIAGSGFKFPVTINQQKQDRSKIDLNLSAKTLEVIKYSMGLVVNSHLGTAYKNRIDRWPYFAGKTGTSQVISKARDWQDLNKRQNKKLRNHGLFVGYAPTRSPRYTCTVIVENGGGGSSSAAPIAREVFKYLYDIKENDEINHEENFNFE